MAWLDTLQTLRAELSEARAERLAMLREENEEREQVRGQLSQLVDSLEIRTLLEELNAVLLEGQGKLEALVSWEATDEEEEDDLPDLSFLTPPMEDDDDGDMISLVLSWEEDGDREIDVDVGDSEQGIFLMVGGIEIRQERAALEDALVEAFRTELEL